MGRSLTFTIVKHMAAAASIAGWASGASAATMIATDGSPLTYAIHSIVGVSDGNTLVLDTKPGGYPVDYASSSLLHYVGGGFAQVTGVGGAGKNGQGFTDLTITPQSPIMGMTEIKFNLDNIPSALPKVTLPSGYKIFDYTFETTIDFVGGGSQIFTNDVGSGNGENRYLIDAGLNKEIYSITISDLLGTFTKRGNPDIVDGLNFNSIKQVSFDGTPASAVPEPSTWASMVLGFLLLGVGVRCRQKPSPKPGSARQLPLPLRV